jgi:UDPglucose 6-dehydrogenase
MKITIFGTGFVGLTSGACLANLGHDVYCVDIDEEKIAMLKKGEIPFYEPGLNELVKRTSEKKRLIFTTNAKEGVDFGEVIFNCVGTPSREDGSADLQYVYAVAKTVASYAKDYKILINKSTVPPKTAKKCQEIVDENLINENGKVDVVSNPEFLKEGNAVWDFMHPDKIVIGAKNEKTFPILRKVYAGLERPYMNVLETDWSSSEMIKYANNSFLATKISFINEMANLCDLVGADIKLISKALGMDYRISPKFLNAGVGYGGSCFAKDVKALAFTAKQYGYDPLMISAVENSNERQKKVLLNKVKKRFGSIEGKTFTIWGLSFKPKTSDIRAAPSLVIIKELLASGAKIKAYDPVANKEVSQIFGNKIELCDNVSSSTMNSSAIILVTEWDEFRNLDLAKLGESMAEKVIFDGRNMYDSSFVKNEGFEHYGIGR